MRPDVSVVIPVYNSKAFLDCLINSVLGQTLTNIEIICVDDGSTDGSGDILRYFADSDHRIQIIEKREWWRRIRKKRRIAACCRGVRLFF